MHTHSPKNGHARICAISHDDLLLRQIIDVELDTWADNHADRTAPACRQPYIDEIVRNIAPHIDRELCIHQFVPEHLIQLIRESIRTLLAS